MKWEKNMFIGQSIQALDSKGRLSIPSKFREILNTKYSGKLILTYLDPYIVAYPTEEWVGIEGRPKQLPTIQKDIRHFFRIIYSNASEIHYIFLDCRELFESSFYPYPLFCRVG